jgi:hypothetical protein
MKSFIALLAVAAAPTGGIDLVHSFKTGEVNKYEVKVKGDLEGRTLEATVVVSVKPLKEAKEGYTDVEFSGSQFELLIGGSDIGANAPESLIVPMNTKGWAKELDIRDEYWMYGVTVFAMMLPGEGVEKDKDVTVSWTTADKGLKVTGKQSLTDLADGTDGQKIATVKSNITMTPDKDEPATLEMTSKFVAATGKLLESSGKLKVGEEGTFDFTIKPVASK